MSVGGTSYVSPGDNCIRVSTQNGRIQVEYPLDAGGYKLGWVDTETGKPAISNVSVYDVSSSGYTVSCTATDASGIASVKFPTWTEANGQDDIRWEEGSRNGNTFTYRVNISAHNNERGKYITHIYAYDIFGNTSVFGTGATVPQPDTTKPVISNVQITDVSSAGYTVSCKATDAGGIKEVRFPTWTDANGQDDIFPNWETNNAVLGQKNGDTYTYYVYASAHNNEAGKYITHIYAYDNNGNSQVYYTGATLPIDVEDIGFNKPTLSFDAIGSKETLTVFLYPNTATDKTVTWATDTPSVATVNGGTVTAVGYGTAVITAKSSNGLIAECEVTVTQPSLTGITVKTMPRVTAYQVGDSLNTAGLTLTASYSNGTTKSIDSGFTCTPTVLNTAGTQKITVNYGGKTTTFNVTVTAAVTNAAVVTCASADASPGETVEVTLDLSDCDDFMNLSLEVGYDSEALILKKATNHVQNLMFVTSQTTATNPYALTWTGTGATAFSGSLVTLTFQVRESAAKGTYPITVDFYKGRTGDNVDGVNVNYDSSFRSLGLRYVSGGITVRENISPVTYTVKFNANGGTGTMKSATATQGQPFTLPANGFTAPDGQRFKAWLIGGKEYQPGDTYTFTANTTVKAVWEDIPVNPTDTVIQPAAVTAFPGQTVQVPVTIANNPGIAGAALTVTYDPAVLTLDSIDKGEVFAKGTFTVNKDAGLVQWYYTETNENITADGTLFTLSFTVNAAAKEGSHPVSVACKDGEAANLSNKDSDPVAVRFGGGAVTVTAGVPGDVTGDHKVLMNDVVKLARSVAGFVTLTAGEKTLGDVTGDGKVLMNDVVKVSRFVAGFITSLAPTAAVQSAGDTAAIQTGTVSGSSGQTVRVPVSITRNPGIAGAAFTVDYDASALTLVGIEKGAVLSKGSFTGDAGKSVVQWYYADENSNTTATGELFLLTFQISSGAAAGSYPVTVALKDNEAANLSDIDAEPVAVTFTPGAVQVGTASGGAVSAAVTATGLSVQLNTPAGVTFAVGFCAAYDGNGQLLGTVPFASGSGTQTLSLPCDGSRARTVKAFFLDSGSRPVTDALETTLP